MRIPRLIAREGWPFIIPGLLLFIVFLLAGFTLTALVFGLLTLSIALFFRDPNRKIVKDENLILSPADGRILEVLHPDDKALQKVCIFMSVLNCHINRIPISGRVTKVEYNSGKFLPAFREKASELNEQNTIYISTDSLEIGVCQIAGLIARRIVCRLKQGDAVSQGSRFGLIRFGSRVDVLLPTDIKILVRQGQKVKAGLSIIGRIKP